MDWQVKAPGQGPDHELDLEGADTEIEEDADDMAVDFKPQPSIIFQKWEKVLHDFFMDSPVSGEHSHAK
jgi:hypothetical protein